MVCVTSADIDGRAGVEDGFEDSWVFDVSSKIIE